MTRSLRLAAVLAVLGCRGRSGVPSRPAPTAPAPPSDAARHVHGGVAAPGDTSGSHRRGVEFVPIEDGQGGADVGWLLLVAHDPLPRQLANLGRRSRCREVPPFVIPTDSAEPPPTALPFASVYCAGPDRAAVLHGLFPSRGELAVVRTECAGGHARCVAPAGFTRFGDRDSVPVALAQVPVPAPLTERPRAAPTPGDGSTRVTVRWSYEPMVQALNYNGTEVAVALEIAGGAARRFDFGPLGVCTEQSPAEMAAIRGRYPRGALLGLHCYSATWANTDLAVAREGDALRLYETATEEMGAVIHPLHATGRVPLPAGATLDVVQTDAGIP